MNEFLSLCTSISACLSTHFFVRVHLCAQLGRNYVYLLPEIDRTLNYYVLFIYFCVLNDPAITFHDFIYFLLNPAACLIVTKA